MRSGNVFLTYIEEQVSVCLCVSGACRATVIQPESTHRDLLNYANVRADCALHVCVCIKL